MPADVQQAFEKFPEEIQQRLYFVRSLIVVSADELELLDNLQETLKWAEPSYLSDKGSTIRLGWKQKRPLEFAIYFNCKTKLLDTFREIYPDEFHYSANRAIVFNLKEQIPIAALKHCLRLSLNYHKIKHLPLLGA